MENAEWWIDEMARADERKNKVPLKTLKATNKRVRKFYMTANTNKKEEVGSLIAHNKRETNKVFGMKTNGDAIENQKLFWKDVKNGESQNQNIMKV